MSDIVISALGLPGRPERAAALSHRDRAILRAVARGTAAGGAGGVGKHSGMAELLAGVDPALFLDGRCCSDQVAARRLVEAGLIIAAGDAAVGQRVRARLTLAGRRVLDAA
jgi:hypothetical protein